MGRKEALQPHWEAPKMWKGDGAGDPVFLASLVPSNLKISCAGIFLSMLAF